MVAVIAVQARAIIDMNLTKVPMVWLILIRGEIIVINRPKEDSNNHMVQIPLEAKIMTAIRRITHSLEV